MEREAKNRLESIKRIEKREKEDRKLRVHELFDIEKIKLNVGGTIFETSSAKIRDDPDSMLYALLFGRFTVPKEDGCVKINRDPKWFRQILNYLRDPNGYILPSSPEDREQVLQEADYFQLQGLISQFGGDRARHLHLGSVNLKMRRDEDDARRSFLDTSIIKDPHLHLINVFKDMMNFVFPKHDPPIPLMLEGARKVSPGAPSIVRDLDAFKENFYGIAPNLKHLDWNNVIVAGGSVLGSLLSKEQAQMCSDIDLFLYGLNPRDAKRKIRQIYHIVGQNAQKVVVVRTSRTITIIPEAKRHRHVQIILRLYESPAEVLLGFDLDCVAVAFDGESIWALPRAQRAINTRINIADPSRQTFRTTSYEHRLWKYSHRGFAVGVPGLNRRRINRQIYNMDFENLVGFSRLLFLEARDYINNSISIGIASRWFAMQGLVGSILTTKNYSDAELVGHVLDYNNGLFLPFSTRDSGELVCDRLFSRCTTYKNHPQYREKRKLHSLSMPTEDELLEDVPDDSDEDEQAETSDHEDRVNKLNAYGTDATDVDEEPTKNPNPKDLIPLYFVYGYGLKSVMDAKKFEDRIHWKVVFSPKRKVFQVMIPRHIRFIGSLKEYIASLPEVEEDWYRQAFEH